jgi:hypothetical protein
VLLRSSEKLDLSRGGNALMRFRNVLTALAVSSLCVITLTACGGSDDDGGNQVGAGDAGQENAQAAGEDSDRPAECELLTGDEVTDVIGPHDGGAQDYVFGGCVWTASSGEDGFTESVAVAVLETDEYEALAEEGEPVEGFGDGATYAEMHGELWFPCQDGKFCGVKARTADGDTRQGFAEQLARTVMARA